MMTSVVSSAGRKVPLDIMKILGVLSVTAGGGIFVMRMLILGLRKDIKHLEESTLLRFKHLEESTMLRFEHQEDIFAANQRATDAQFKNLEDVSAANHRVTIDQFNHMEAIFVANQRATDAHFQLIMDKLDLIYSEKHAKKPHSQPSPRDPGAAAQDVADSNSDIN